MALFDAQTASSETVKAVNEEVGNSSCIILQFKLAKQKYQSLGMRHLKLLFGKAGVMLVRSRAGVFC